MDHKSARWISTLFAAAGAALVAASWAGVFPAAELARALSGDGEITAAFAQNLERSQWTLAILLLLFSPAAFLGPQVYAVIRRALVSQGNAAAGFAVGFTALALTLGVQQTVLDGIPHVTDETCHDFQAKVFASGRVCAPLPPCPLSFYQHQILMSESGKWFSKYPPGHSLLLAAGRLAGMPGLVVPLCSAVSAVLLMLIVSRFHGRAAGRCAGLLFAFSPLAILLGASWMSHSTATACLLAAVFLFIGAMDRCERRLASILRALAAGVFAGAALITRSQDVVIAGVVALAALALMDRQARRTAMRLAVPTAVGTIPSVAVLLMWNQAVYGNAFILGYGYSLQGLLVAPIHTAYGFSDSFTFAQAASYTGWSLLRFDNALFGWPVSLIFLPFAFLPGRAGRADWLSAIGCMAVAAILLPFNYFGSEYEARYYLPMVPFAILLSVRGLQNLYHWFAGRFSRRAAQSLAVMIPGLFFLHAIFFYWPCYLAPRYSGSYEQASPIVHRLAQQENLSNALVLIDSTGENEFRYSSGFIYNDPLLRADVIYARDIPEQNACLFDAFADRRIYRFLPDEDWTGGRFEEINRASGQAPGTARPAADTP